MSMTEFFCEFFELDIRISQENFNKEAFFADINVDDENKEHYMWSYGSTTNPGDQHAHIVVNFRDEDKVRLRITYHAFGGDDGDTRPPYMEDCAQWLSTFIQTSDIPAQFRSGFNFGKAYSSILALPFPLLTASEDLAGSQISGVRIKPASHLKIKTAIIQREREGTTLYLESKTTVTLKQFDLDAFLQKLFKTAMKFVRKTGETDEMAE